MMLLVNDANADKRRVLRHEDLQHMPISMPTRTSGSPAFAKGRKASSRDFLLAFIAQSSLAPGVSLEARVSLEMRSQTGLVRFILLWEGFTLSRNRSAACLKAHYFWIVSSHTDGIRRP